MFMAYLSLRILCTNAVSLRDLVTAVKTLSKQPMVQQADISFLLGLERSGSQELLVALFIFPLVALYGLIETHQWRFRFYMSLYSYLLGIWRNRQLSGFNCDRIAVSLGF